MEKVTYIPGRIESKATGNIVTGARNILDDVKGKRQSVINSEVNAALVRLDQEKQNVLNFDETPTEDSQNPVTSAGVFAADKALGDAIGAILLLIPSAASALNQLADKIFVNSSISTATATPRGTYNLVSDLDLTTDATRDAIAEKLGEVIDVADLNDYAFVQVPVSDEDPTEIERTERYKFNGDVWIYEYTLNTSGFTAAQWEAINSGITAALVAKLDGLPTEEALELALGTITQNIQNIGALIPSEATAQNQLADKAYVLAQILAATPSFKGQFMTLAQLQDVTGAKAGDLGIVRTKDSDGHDVFTFYQHLNDQWNEFFVLSYHPQDKPATTGWLGDYPYNGMGRIELPMNMVDGWPDNTWINLPKNDVVYLLYSWHLQLYAVYNPTTHEGLGLNDNLVIKPENYDIADLEEIVNGHYLPFTESSGVWTITKPDDSTITSTELNNTNIYHFNDPTHHGINVLTQAMLTQPNTIYVIQHDYDLNGTTITIPANCVLEFEGGSLSNGTLIFQDTYVNCTNAALDVAINGTFKNDVVYSSWFNSNEDILLSAITACCENSRTFIFTKGNYTFTKDICIFNGLNLRGEEATITFDFDRTGKTEWDAVLCGIICGTRIRHNTDWSDLYKWYGEISDLSLRCVGIPYVNSLIFLGSVENCTVKNCTLDISDLTVQEQHSVNSIICGKNNNLILLESLGSRDNIHIFNNIIICDKSDFRLHAVDTQPEAIGFDNGWTNLYIEKNKILYCGDDLGIHRCEHVYIKDNFILSCEGRIYCSETGNLYIENNYLEVVHSWSMGIVVEREFSSSKCPNNIFIKNNVVKTSNDATLTYGIRVRYGKNIVIDGNNLYSGGITIEAEADGANLTNLALEDRFADYVTIVNNKMYGINTPFGTNPDYVPKSYIICNNFVEYSFVISRATVANGNVFGPTITNVVFSDKTFERQFDGYIDFLVDATVPVANNCWVKGVTPIGTNSVTLPFKSMLLSKGFCSPKTVTDVTNTVSYKVYVDTVSSTRNVTISDGESSYNVLYSAHVVPANTEFRAIFNLKAAGTYVGKLAVRVYYINLENGEKSNSALLERYKYNQLTADVNDVDYSPVVTNP